MELLVVITILAVLLVLLVPIFTTRKSSDDATAAAFAVTGALENARTFAVSNNTYVWVGFFEEDANGPNTKPRPAGVGRVVMSVVASREGNRYKDSNVSASEPHAFYPPPPSPTPIPGSDSNPVMLTQIGPIRKIDNSDLVVLPQTNLPRPVVTSDYQVAAPEFAMHPPTLGSSAVSNPTTFNYPLAAAPADVEYIFTKIIEFNPRGEAMKIVDLPTQLIEIGLRPTHGNVPDMNSPNVVAIQLSCATGAARMYRP
jgi:type II secretory pathway pseudopilin PulG